MTVGQKKGIAVVIMAGFLVIAGLAFVLPSASDSAADPEPDQEEARETSIDGGETDADASASDPSEDADGQPPNLSDEADDEAPEGPANAQDHLSEDEQEASQDVALAFVEAYAAFDAADPTAHIDEAREHMSDALYETMKEQPSRGTMTRAKVEPEDLAIMNTGNEDENLIQWGVLVTGTAEDADGDESDIEMRYVVDLEPTDDTYEVVDVYVNPPT